MSRKKTEGKGCCTSCCWSLMLRAGDGLRAMFKGLCEVDDGGVWAFGYSQCPPFLFNVSLLLLSDYNVRINDSDRDGERTDKPSTVSAYWQSLVTLPLPLLASAASKLSKHCLLDDEDDDAVLRVFWFCGGQIYLLRTLRGSRPRARPNLYLLTEHVGKTY